MTEKIKIAVTCGEPAGIGPETALKALAAFADPEVEFLLVGTEAAWEKASELTGIGFSGRWRILGPEGADPGSFEWGKMNPSTAMAATLAVEEAVRMALSGGVDAVVTAPLTKEGLRMSGRNFPGHTELLAAMCKVERPTMAFYGEKFFVSLATTHLPLAEVAKNVTGEGVFTAVSRTHSALMSLGIPSPRIAVCGLNPHAGEHGLLGGEEEAIIGPAIEKARAKGIDATGPHPGDAVFHKLRGGGFDAAVAMYHDQGLAPFKLLHFHDGVNVTLGLPIIRTSPDHGTAFDIAGKGVADPGSTATAISLAVRMAKNRNRGVGN